MTSVAKFVTCIAGVFDTGGKFMVSTIPAADCRRIQEHRWQFSTGINDTDGKFVTVSATPVANNGNSARLLKP
jgi:hypothetical protein